MSKAATKLNTQQQLFARAHGALEIYKKIDELSALLETDKEFMRHSAGGDTLTIDVPGKGSVQVKKPTEAKTSMVTSFDEEKFDALPVETRTLLMSLGVVVRKEVSRAAGKAAVVFTLNK